MQQDKILYINSTNLPTDLCIIGGKTNTDKSPFAYYSPCMQHRKGYTAVYSMLFSQYRHKPIHFAEIGIEQGNSLHMWVNWFTAATIHGFEYYPEKLQHCAMYQFPRTELFYVDVSKKDVITSSFTSTNTLYDIIIDDSSHIRSHQNNILQTVPKFIKSGGIFIIEDIERDTPISEFKINEDDWVFYSFIVCDHANRNCCDNDKILYFIKK